MIETREIGYRVPLESGMRLCARGYALRLPEPWSDIRLCVRSRPRFTMVALFNHEEEWVIDHYRTGMSLTSLIAPARTRERAIECLLAALRNASEHQLHVLRTVGARRR